MCLCHLPRETKDRPVAPSPLPRPGRGSGEPVEGPGRGGTRLPPGVYKPLIQGRDVERVLRAMLRANEPRAVRLLVSTVTASARDIKFEEIRLAIQNGQLDASRLEAMRRDIVRFTNEDLAPRYEAMAKRAHAIHEAAIRAGYRRGPSWEAAAGNVRRWIQEHGTELAVNLSQAQHEATRVIITELGVNRRQNPTEVARAVRGVIGLTPAQARAVTRYDAVLREQGKSGRALATELTRYEQRLTRVRADRIARTELASAWNMGADETVRAGIRAGDLPDQIRKTVHTAADEAVCEWCGPLNGESVGMDESFPGSTSRMPNVLTPPFHPRCRCVVTYDVVS